MFRLSGGRRLLVHLPIALVWASAPAFLVYSSLFQLPLLSRLRLGIPTLLFLLLAFVAHQMIPRLESLEPRHWLVLLVGCAVVACFGSAALFFFPEPTSIYSPQHELRIDASSFQPGQTLEVRSLETSLGNISYSSFVDVTGWQRLQDALVPTAASPAPLVWKGWTGDKAVLRFSGSPGVRLEITWDGQSQTVELGTSGRGVVSVPYEFTAPLWSKALLGLVLTGTLFFSVVILWLIGRNRMPVLLGQTIPEWMDRGMLAPAVLLSIVFVIFATVLLSKASLHDWELALVLALAFLFVLPVGMLAQGSLAGLTQRIEASELARKLKRHRRLLALLVLGLLILVLYGPGLAANWNVIDDHEIIQFLAPDGKMSLHKLFLTLPATEAGKFGVSARFRPTYYTLRLFETLLWGAQPFYWHAFRILILICAIYLAWMLVSPALGWLVSTLLCAYMLTFAYLVDVIGKLGASETYAVLGLPLFVWGVVQGLEDNPVPKKQTILNAGAVLLGSVLCIGSKENFVLLIVPLLYLAYRSLRNGRMILLASAAASVLLGVWITASILLAVTHTGTDVYANPVSPAYRAANTLQGLVSPQNQVTLLTLLGISVLLAILWLVYRPEQPQRKQIAAAQFWLGALIAIWLSQLVFYNGLWPTGSRYDFPGLLCIPAAVFILAWLAQRLVPGPLSAVLRASIALALLGIILLKGYEPISQGIVQNVTETQEFGRTLQQIVSLSHEHKDYALVIESGRAIDYEPVLSYPIFLRNYGVQNPLFLRIHGYSLDQAEPGLQAELTSSLVQISQQGNGDILPLKQLSSFGTRCYSLSLSGDFSTECVPIK